MTRIWHWLQDSALRIRTATVFVWAMICLLAAAAADAEPMNLVDPEPRWVGVRFEVSPHGRPGQRDTIYTQRFPAWVDPIDAERLRVTVASDVVEQHLMGEQLPVPGSFSDFEWVFDRRTGEVLSASFQGKVSNEIRYGLVSTRVHTEISVRMSTKEQAGYEMPRQIMRHRVFPYCGGGEEKGEGCTLVTAHSYQQSSGYVNAVGELQVHSPFATLRTFSPLGEAVFSELPTWPDYDVELSRPASTREPSGVQAQPTLLGETTHY
jgi:hypothetical protein